MGSNRTQTEAIVEPDWVADDDSWKAVARVANGSIIHPLILSAQDT